MPFIWIDKSRKVKEMPLEMILDVQKFKHDHYCQQWPFIIPRKCKVCSAFLCLLQFTPAPSPGSASLSSARSYPPLSRESVFGTRSLLHSTSFSIPPLKCWLLTLTDISWIKQKLLLLVVLLMQVLDHFVLVVDALLYFLQVLRHLTEILFLQVVHRLWHFFGCR